MIQKKIKGYNFVGLSFELTTKNAIMDHLSKLNNEELLKKGKSLKIITFILVLLLVVSIIASILNYLENGFRISTLMPIILLAIVFPNIATLKAIKIEVQLRGLN